MQILLVVFLFTIAAAVWFYDIGAKEYAEFLLHVITAIGVFSAVTMAVYGERIKRLWNRIDLSIENPEESNNFFDEIVTDTGKTKVLCHHLRVRNKTPTQPVTNCRVWLVKILDQNDSGGFEENFKFAVPRLMGGLQESIHRRQEVFQKTKCLILAGLLSNGVADLRLAPWDKAECLRAIV
jgi:hypothetical protein